MTTMSEKDHHLISEQNQFPGNRAFAPALLDPDLEVPGGMIDPDGEPAPKRFSVYRNNVVSSLIEAMAETYPSLKKILGEENFATLSRIFISKHPPTSPMMQTYGDLFPDFIEQFEPLAHSPFLVDVALLEKKWIEAYHAADASGLEGAELGAIPPETLMETRFIPHPAASITQSDYSLYDMFSLRHHGEDADPASVSHDKAKSGQAVLVTRPHLSVNVVQLDQAIGEFLNLILSGKTLGQSVEAALQLDGEFDAATAISLMLSSAAVCGIAAD